MPKKKSVRPAARKINRQDNALLTVSAIVMLALVYLAAYNIFNLKYSNLSPTPTEFSVISGDKNLAGTKPESTEKEGQAGTSSVVDNRIETAPFTDSSPDSDTALTTTLAPSPDSSSDEPFLPPNSSSDEISSSSSPSSDETSPSEQKPDVSSENSSNINSNISSSSPDSSSAVSELMPEPELEPEPIFESEPDPLPESEPIPDLLPESIPEPEPALVLEPEFPYEPISELETTPAPAPDPSLIFGSFFNTFSSDAALNLSRTDLYQDRSATAVFFTPDYSWQTAGEGLGGDFSVPALNNFTGPYLDRRCLGANCLEQRWNELYYNNQLLVYPTEVSAFISGGGEVAAVSIFTLSERWVVGFTLKNKSGGYQGAVYYFNGQNFLPLITTATATKISSPYFGLFGGGGAENDFLLIYGAYKGIAYRVRGENLTNISEFFDIRAMVNGFKPEVIRLVRDDSAVWYVFSSTLSRPTLIKLWQNKTSEIVGEAIFRKLLIGFDSVIFKLSESVTNKVVLSAKAQSNDSDLWYIFTDYGFKNSTPAVLEFNPISRSRGEIEIEKISLSRLDLDAPSLALGGDAVIKFLFSKDGNNWQELPIGSDISFPTGKIASFFLKVIFPSLADKFYSPFLSSVTFNYYYK